jgi:hypothetical protein
LCGTDIRTDLKSLHRIAQAYQHFDSEPMDFLPLLNELQVHLKLKLDFCLAKDLPKGFGMGIFELMFSMMTFTESAGQRANALYAMGPG